jgi:thioredoxin 2
MSDAPRKATIRCPHCGTLNSVDLDRAADGPRCGSCKKPILLDRPLKATGGDFDRTIGASPVPVLVDFFADWCGPCHMLAPVLDSIAQERMGQALVLKVDTEADPQLAMKYNVRALPTIVAFRGGKESGRVVGVQPKPAIEKLIA